MNNHFGTVAFERSKFPAPIIVNGKLTNPLGLENAHAVTNAVGYTHRAEGWGLRKKTSGTNWNGRAVDVLINKQIRKAVDCLGDSEGRGVPLWDEIKYETWFDDEWLPPTDGTTPVPPPIPPIPPVPPPVPVIIIRDQLTSQNNTYTLQIQDDGNLVIYRAGQPVWASGSAQK